MNKKRKDVDMNIINNVDMNIINNVDINMVKCCAGTGGAIFEEYGNDADEISIKEAAEYIVAHEFDETFWDDLDDLGITSKTIDNVTFTEHLIVNHPELEFVIACRLYRRGQQDPYRVITTWNKAMKNNGESHGTIFAGLHKAGEYEFLQELMNDIGNVFNWDT